jgi:hypothetical protein
VASSSKLFLEKAIEQTAALGPAAENTRPF